MKEKTMLHATITEEQFATFEAAKVLLACIVDAAETLSCKLDETGLRGEVVAPIFKLIGHAAVTSYTSVCEVSQCFKPVLQSTAKEEELK